jgi:methyl-accepting chemotaxis protein
LNRVLDRSEKASEMQQMVIGILEARRHEKNLLLRHEPKYRDATLKASGEVKQKATEMRQRFQQQDNKKLMDDVIAAINDYEAAFQLVAREVESGNTQHAALEDLDKKMVAAARKAQEACDTARQDQQGEMKAAIAETNQANITFTLLFLIAGGIGAFVVIRGIMRSIATVVEGTRGVSEGDLAIPPIPANSTEMGRLGEAFNSMLVNIASIVKTVAGTGARVSVSANKIHRVAEQISETAAEVALQANSVAEASTEVANSSAAISHNCHLAAEGALRAKQSAETGSAVVEQTVRLMKEIAQTVQTSSQTVVELGERSNQIGAIIGTIKDIADQTNLLALNAAIEAARAGEQGRGFAVVADEVRKLAERTAKATQEIGTMIGTIQQETSNAVQAMARGTDQVEAITVEAGRSGEALADILAQVSELALKLEQISTASERQSASSEEISGSIQSITSTIQVTASEAHASAESASEMNAIAEELMGNLGKFKVEEDVPLAISKAKSAHMIFIGKVKAHLDGAHRLDPDNMPTHTTCAFGKWYQSKGKQAFGANSCFAGIDGPHAQVHNLGRQAVQASNAGEASKARGLCAQMEQASMDLIAMLEQLERMPVSRAA